jgi:threonine dehydratase
MLTKKDFDEACSVVSRVTLETKLIYSDFLSDKTGNKVYLKPENMQFTGAYRFVVLTTRFLPCLMRSVPRA